MFVHVDINYFAVEVTMLFLAYSKQQKLSRRKPLRFLQIFEKSQKFSLLIEKRCPVDMIMEAKSRRFS